MTEAEVVAYMKEVLGSITDTISLTDAAITDAAKLVQAVYKEPYANFTDQLKWRLLSDFFAINAALNFAVSFYKFSADGAIIEGSDLYKHLISRWNAALSMVQSYLTDAGLTVVAPGSQITPKNYDWRIGYMNTNYLLDVVD